MSRKLELTEDMFIRNAESITKILRRAVRHALLDHKRAGNPVATWKDGKVVLLQPDEIPVDENSLEDEQNS
ncbi:MAG TPA: hypothetical protein VID27_18480 [Blastocatellia bacterium]|jgi:hypothetical protein